MSSPANAGGSRLAPLPPPPRRGVEAFRLPDLVVAEAAPESDEPEPVAGFTPMLLADQPMEDPRVSAEDQAREMLASAQAEATGIRQQAQREGYEEGYQKGYQTGLEEGMVASRARVEAACDNLGRALGVLDKARAGILGVMETEMMALVQAATDRILLAPEAIEPALVRRVVHEAVLRVAEAERMVVRLHPDDLAHVREFRARLIEDLGGMANLELRPDPSLRPGDCVVDTPTAQIDATLESRRRQIFKLLSDSFRQGQRMDLERVLERALEPPAADSPSAAPASPAATTPAVAPTFAPPAEVPSELEDW